jgi:hypothetical protein
MGVMRVGDLDSDRWPHAIPIEVGCTLGKAAQRAASDEARTVSAPARPPLIRFRASYPGPGQV